MPVRCECKVWKLSIEQWQSLPWIPEERKKKLFQHSSANYCSLWARMAHFKTIDEAGHLKRRNYAILWMIWSIWSFSLAVCADNPYLYCRLLLKDIAPIYAYIRYECPLTPFIFPFSTIHSQLIFFFFSSILINISSDTFRAHDTCPFHCMVLYFLLSPKVESTTQVFTVPMPTNTGSF